MTPTLLQNWDCEPKTDITPIWTSFWLPYAQGMRLLPLIGCNHMQGVQMGPFESSLIATQARVRASIVVPGPSLR